MVLYAVTTHQMTQNLHINAQNLDGLSEKSDAFENTQWRKAKQMQAMRLCFQIEFMWALIKHTRHVILNLCVDLNTERVIVSS